MKLIYCYLRCFHFGIVVGIDPIKDLYRNKLKKPYYYVSPCPNCGSLITGRFVKARNDYDADWLIDESLRHGEIVSPVPDVLSENCFCCDLCAVR